MTEAEARARIVAEALTWEKTPYQIGGRVRGVGCDCAMFPLEVYLAAGVIGDPGAIAPYSEQFNLHRDAERYLDMVRRVVGAAGGRQLVPGEDPTGPGDFALWRYGRTMSHGAIILDWPRIVHSTKPGGVIRDNARLNARLADPLRERILFTLW